MAFVQLESRGEINGLTWLKHLCFLFQLEYLILSLFQHVLFALNGTKPLLDCMDPCMEPASNGDASHSPFSFIQTMTL